MFRVLLILFLLTTSVSAGPWPREERKGFLAFSLDLDAEDFDDNFISFYMEYGLSRGRTLVIDRQERGDRIAKTFALIRFPIGDESRSLKLAYDVGLGTVDRHFALRTGLSVGKGWSLGNRSGWWTIDSRALLLDEGDEVIFESDLTFGIQLTDRLKAISQLQGGLPSDGDAFGKFAQTFALQTSKTRHYFLGVTAGFYEADSLQVNIGLWQDF